MSSSERLRDKLYFSFVDRVLFGAILFVGGLTIQALYTHRVTRRTDARERVADELRGFVVPLSLRLEMDSVYTCNRPKQLYSPDSLSELMRWRFVYGTVLPNEEAARSLIETRGDILAADSDLKKAAFAYARHVAQYRVIAENPATVDTSSRADSKWSETLLPLLRVREESLSHRLAQCDDWKRECTTPIRWPEQAAIGRTERACAWLSVNRMAPGAQANVGVARDKR